MDLVALAHSKFEWPKYFSQDPPFKYVSSIVVSSIVLRLLLRRSRKFLFLSSEA